MPVACFNGGWHKRTLASEHKDSHHPMRWMMKGLRSNTGDSDLLSSRMGENRC